MYKFAVEGRRGPLGAIGAIGGPLEAVGGRRGYRGADGPKGSYVRPVLYMKNFEKNISFQKLIHPF